jgi:hypothetical protein
LLRMPAPRVMWPRIVVSRHGPVVAVTDPIARHTAADPPFQAAVRLLGEVLQVQRVHRALDPDMQLADLALGHGPQSDPEVAQVLVQRGDVGQVT